MIASRRKISLHAVFIKKGSSGLEGVPGVEFNVPILQTLKKIEFVYRL
jgi:hypothetical protein